VTVLVLVLEVVVVEEEMTVGGVVSTSPRHHLCCGCGIWMVPMESHEISRSTFMLRSSDKRPKIGTEAHVDARTYVTQIPPQDSKRTLIYRGSYSVARAFVDLLVRTFVVLEVFMTSV
jgi:hypothetical protein